MNVQEECSKMFAILPNHTMSSGVGEKKRRGGGAEIWQTSLYVLTQTFILQTSVKTKAKLENL